MGDYLGIIDQRYFPSDPVAIGQWAAHDAQRSQFYDRIRADREKSEAMLHTAYDYSGLWGVPRKNQFLPSDQVIVSKTTGPEDIGMNTQAWQGYSQVRRPDGSAYSQEGTSWDVPVDPQAHDLDAFASKSLRPRNAWTSRPQTLIEPFRPPQLQAGPPANLLQSQSPNRPNLIVPPSAPPLWSRLARNSSPSLPVPLLVAMILLCFVFLLAYR